MDVLDLLSLASRELTGDVDDAKLDWSVDTALVGLPNTNGLYDPDLLPEVASRLRAALQVLAGGV